MGELWQLQALFDTKVDKAAEMVAARLAARTQKSSGSKLPAYSVEYLIRMWYGDEGKGWRDPDDVVRVVRTEISQKLHGESNEAKRARLARYPREGFEHLGIEPLD